MPIDTNTSVAPWYDDFNVDKEFYGVLYKPKTSVQARELNQMQSILRHQIEKFGDAIFQIGTIIDGCNFVFYPSYPYVKIKDLTTDGLNVTLANYVGLFTKSTANLQAIIINTAVGFETTSPDLNTLYLSYRNSGNNSNTFQYTAGDVLTIFDSNTGIWAVTVNTAGAGFSNSDVPIFTSALAVNVTSGSFTNGSYITQPSTGANLQIIGIDATTYAGKGQIILSLLPRSTDLANATANGSQWAVANNDSIRTPGNTGVGTVMAVIGAGAGAAPVTDGSGRIIQIAMQARGSNYTILPTLTIKSANNSSGITSLSLVPQNFVTKVTVANTVGAVGTGYAFGVSDGTIYQKGLFLKVDAQTIIVDKYDTSPNNVSVGFRSNEQIINANIDTSLLDNASGFSNFQAPGADRLKITPTLALQAADVTDPNFLAIVSWSEGNPYRQNQATAYSAIGDKIAQGMFEAEGDFVLSRFEVTSRSPYTRAFEGSKVSIMTNPGAAYIKGQRVFNNTNYATDIAKTTDTATSNNRFITLNYGNWIRVKEVGGIFQFSTGDVVTFYDAAKSFLSGGAVLTGAAITPAGNALGTARIRSMVHEFGIPGDASASYKLYLFDIVLNAGVNFADIRSVSYAGTYSGIADVVLTLSPSTQTNVAILANTDYDYLLFDSGATVLKNATQINYTYRTIDQTTSIANTGLLSKNISSTPGETFPYSGSLTTTQLQDLYVVPVGNTLFASANATGSANTLTTANLITGNATTWITDFTGGDYVYIFSNSTVHDVRKVVSVANNVAMQLDANVAFSLNNCGVYRCFPVNAPIALGLRSGLTANVSANGQLLTVNLGMALQGSVTVNTAIAVNILRTNVSAASKTAARDQLVKICTGNNVGGTSGPWCLGVSDVFRLKRIFLDSANTVSANSTEVTSYFYIDHKQNEDYLDLGYLYLRPNSGLSLANGQYLLCQFDTFQVSGSGFFDTVSYVGANAAVIAATDSTPLANLGSSVSSWEIPECFGSRGQYFDLMKYFDFRPLAANSVSPTTNAATAPLNPSYSLSFGNTANPANDKKFPLPDSPLQYNMEQYCYRIDSVFADKGGKISVVRGIPATNAPKTPHMLRNSIRLTNVYLPPYPCLPAVRSPMQEEILTTRIANINYLGRRAAARTITVPSAPGTPYDTQPRRYTMADTGTLERRIQALEYYNALNALQSDMVSRVVPSSVDGSVNRFKFGVFADAFDTAISQDVTNPSYAAVVSQSNMTPPVVEWVVGYGDAKAASVPYLDFKIISQPDATVPIPPIVVTPLPPTPQPNTPAPIIASANVWLLRTDHLAASQSGQIVLTDYAYPQFANTTGAVTATLYFYINPTTTTFSGAQTIDPDNFQIYQGSTLVADAYTSATALSAADVAYLQSDAVPGNWFQGLPLSTALARPAAGFVNGAGRLDFTHVPSNGLNYTIISTRQSQYDHWIWGLRYPSAFGSEIVVSPSATAASYAGHMDVQPATLLLAMTTPTSSIPTAGGIGQNQTSFSLGGYGGSASVYFGDQGTDYTSVGTGLLNYLTLDQGLAPYGGMAAPAVQATSTLIPQHFGVTVYGLKPSTSHTLYVNDVIKTNRTQVAGQALGQPLISDANGIMKFNYFYDGNSLDQDVTTSFIGPNSGQREWAAEVAASMSQPIGTGSLTMTLLSPGGVSSASFTLQVVADADLVLSTITLTRAAQGEINAAIFFTGQAG